MKGAKVEPKSCREWGCSDGSKPDRAESNQRPGNRIEWGKESDACVKSKREDDGVCKAELGIWATIRRSGHENP